jgi:hypothetical protein
LQNHKEEIILFLQQNYIDILLISETHFTTKNYFLMPRYKLYCTNQPDGTAHGGTAILIQETIEQYELLQNEEESFQATSIQVNGFPDNHHGCLLPSPTQPKTGPFCDFISDIRTKVHSWRRLQ